LKRKRQRKLATQCVAVRPNVTQDGEAMMGAQYLADFFKCRESHDRAIFNAQRSTFNAHVQ
jgi:hypothetical protein